MERRARTAKVQVHAVRCICRGMEFSLPQELDALVDKTAATLATSLFGELQMWLPAVIVALPLAAAHRRLTLEMWPGYCL